MELSVLNFYVRSRLPSLSDNPISRRNSRLNFTQAKRVPLLVFNPKDGQFYLSQAAEKVLASLKGKCYVISVSGSPLVGKSSLLNLLLSIYSSDSSQVEMPYQDIYPVGNNIKSTTEGIDMYCLSRNGKNFIFLDVEGDNDLMRGDTGTWIETNLIQAAVGVSHIHLYNYLKFPQQSLLTYFETIKRIVTQNEIHEEFETKYTFLRKDFRLEDEKDDEDGENEKELAQMLEITTLMIEKKLKPQDFDLHFLHYPPQHIARKKSKTSCIGSSKRVLCQDCNGHLFVSKVRDISKGIKQHLNEVAPFKTGSDLISALKEVLDINRREMPFSLDSGWISKIRSERIEKEQLRIRDGLLEVEQYQAQNGLYKEVQKIMDDHPSLANDQLSKDFKRTGMFLETKISQMEYMVAELSKFIEQYLLDDKASILNEPEKKALWEAYVAPFGRILKELTTSLKKYGEMIEEICKNLLEIQTHTTAHLREYLAVASETRNRTITISVELMSSGLLGFLGREAAGRIIAGVFVGGGVIGGILTAFFFYQAWQKLKEAMKKNEEALNLMKIDGIKDGKDAKEEMKKMEEFVTELVDDLEKSRETLKKICSEDESEYFNLIAKISNAMDEKINGVNLSTEARNQLLEKMNVAENNLERFKQCL